MFKLALKRSVLVALVLAAVAGARAQERGALGSQTETLPLVVNEPRPLAAMGRDLMRKYGVPISYEDVKWEDMSDAVPVGQLQNRNDLRNPDMKVAAPGTLQVNIESDKNTRRAVTSLETVLGEAVSQHTGRGNPGRFEILKLDNDEGFVVVPKQGKNRDGAWVTSTSPLNARISFPEEERNDDAVFDAILKSLAAATGEQLTLYFEKPPGEGTIRLGANNEVARDVLRRALKQLYPWKAYWRLYHTPGETSWGLNIGPVSREATTAQGTVFLDLVYWPLSQRPR
jgi:hypothetical protein